MNNSGIMGHMRGRIGTVLRVSVGVLACLSCSTAAADKSTAAKQPAPAKTLVGQEAQAVGVRQCVPRIDQMTDFLLADSTGGVHTFFPGKQADSSLLSSSFEVISHDVSSYASASFAPVGKRGCGAVYEAVTYWQNDCDAVASEVYAQMKRTGVLRQRIQVLEAGNTARVFLMPAGQGCLSIKKEIIH